MTVPCRGPATAASFGSMISQIIPNRIVLLSDRIADGRRFCAPDARVAGEVSRSTARPAMGSEDRAVPARRPGQSGTSLALWKCSDEGWTASGGCRLHAGALHRKDGEGIMRGKGAGGGRVPGGGARFRSFVHCLADVRGLDRMAETCLVEEACWASPDGLPELRALAAARRFSAARPYLRGRRPMAFACPAVQGPACRGCPLAAQPRSAAPSSWTARPVYAERTAIVARSDPARQGRRLPARPPAQGGPVRPRAREPEPL